MRQTKKYTGAVSILTYPHESQKELYQELNRLGWFWNSKTQKWERDESIKALDETDLVKIRIWAGNSRVNDVCELLLEAIESAKIGLVLQEQSLPYICRPPNNNESRIYLTFVIDVDA